MSPQLAEGSHEIMSRKKKIPTMKNSTKGGTDFFFPQCSKGTHVPYFGVASIHWKSQHRSLGLT